MKYNYILSSNLISLIKLRETSTISPIFSIIIKILYHVFFNLIFETMCNTLISFQFDFKVIVWSANSKFSHKYYCFPKMKLLSIFPYYYYFHTSIIVFQNYDLLFFYSL